MQKQHPLIQKDKHTEHGDITYGWVSSCYIKDLLNQPNIDPKLYSMCGLELGLYWGPNRIQFGFLEES